MSLNNGKLEVFDYKSGKKICEKRLGVNMQIEAATFFAEDAIEIGFNQQMVTIYLAAKNSTEDLEKNSGAAKSYKQTSLNFNYPLTRFVIDDRIQVTVFNPSAHDVSQAREWLLVSAKKIDGLALCDQCKTEAL